jgi:hypothetical protein
LVDQLTHYAQLKGFVFRRKALNPRRLKGISAFASTFGIYWYLPYMAVYTGTATPIFVACMAGLYGMNSFSDTNMVNSIKVVENGTLEINVALSPFASKTIHANIKAVKSVVSLHNDDIGEDDQEGNIIRIDTYQEAGETINTALHLQLPGDAFRDRQYIDWLLSDKQGEGDLADDFQDLMHKRYIEASSHGKIGAIDLAVAKLNSS